MQIQIIRDKIYITDPDLDSFLKTHIASGDLKEKLEDKIRSVRDASSCLRVNANKLADSYRRIAFHWSVVNGEWSLLKHLIKTGVHVDDTDENGLTAMQLAEKNHHNDIADYLDRYLNRKLTDAEIDYSQRSFVDRFDDKISGLCYGISLASGIMDELGYSAIWDALYKTVVEFKISKKSQLEENITINGEKLTIREVRKRLKNFILDCHGLQHRMFGKYLKLGTVITLPVVKIPRKVINEETVMKTVHVEIPRKDQDPNDPGVEFKLVTRPVIKRIYSETIFESYKVLSFVNTRQEFTTETLATFLKRRRQYFSGFSLLIMSFQHALRLSVDNNTVEWILRDPNNPDRVFRCFDSLILAEEILGSYGMSPTLELTLISSQPHQDINFTTLFLSGNKRRDQKRRMSLPSLLPSQVDREEQRLKELIASHQEFKSSRVTYSYSSSDSIENLCFRTFIQAVKVNDFDTARSLFEMAMKSRSYTCFFQHKSSILNAMITYQDYFIFRQALERNDSEFSVKILNNLSTLASEEKVQVIRLAASFTKKIDEVGYWLMKHTKIDLRPVIPSAQSLS